MIPHLQLIPAGSFKRSPGACPARVLASLLLIAAVAGCADADPDRTSSDTPDSIAAPIDSIADTTVTASPEPEARLALEADGLRIFLTASGSARPIPFGTPATDVMDVLTRVRGEGPREEGHSEDCGVDYATWDDGFTVRFSDDSLAGWSVGPGSTLTTASGVGVGSTRSELENVYTAEVGRTSLGIEFTAGGLAGILESEAPDARVLHLWSGIACVAR